jgi:hypothetical protein
LEQGKLVIGGKIWDGTAMNSMSFQKIVPINGELLLITTEGVMYIGSIVTKTTPYTRTPEEKLVLKEIKVEIQE